MDYKNLSFSQISEQVEQERRAKRDKEQEDYKKRLESDLIICEYALLNYPERAKKINSLISYLNKKLEVLK